MLFRNWRSLEANAADNALTIAAARAQEREIGIYTSGYVICRDTEAEAQAELDRVLDVRSSPEAYASYQDFVTGSQLESRVSLEEYSVSNRGLRSGLIGTPDQIEQRLRAYEQAGVDLMLLQFSPQRRAGGGLICGFGFALRCGGTSAGESVARKIESAGGGSGFVALGRGE